MGNRVRKGRAATFESVLTNIVERSRAGEVELLRFRPPELQLVEPDNVRQIGAWQLGGVWLDVHRINLRTALKVFVDGHVVVHQFISHSQCGGQEWHFTCEVMVIGSNSRLPYAVVARAQPRVKTMTIVSLDLVPGIV